MNAVENTASHTANKREYNRANKGTGSVQPVLFWFRLLACICLCLSFSVKAELSSLSDEQMMEVTGQAFISIDNYNYENTDFLRINLGMDIETQLNIDELELGRYYRWENGDACLDCDGTEAGLEKMPADIMVENFALGHINKSTNKIDPFKIKDPFLEFAFDASGTPTGIRLGFGKSKGWLSGDIKALTGNVDIAIRDTAQGLASLSPNCWSGDFSCLLGFMMKFLGGPILQDAPLGADAMLINDEGQPDPVRGTMVGMESGTALVVDGKGELNGFEKFLLDVLIGLTPNRYNASRHGEIVTFHSSGCDILTVPVCFPLENFGSFEIGRDDPVGVDGLFVSFQNSHDVIKWAQSFKNGVTGSEVTAFQATGFGGFFNIPNDGVQVNLNEAMKGIDRQRTEYIDRGKGLF
jgi:hypothetical protein